MPYRLTIEYGDDVLLSTAMRAHEFEAEARLLLAAKLFEMGKLSSGQAARLCGKDRIAFLMSLSRIGVNTSNLSAEDAEDELSFGRAS